MSLLASSRCVSLAAILCIVAGRAGAQDARPSNKAEPTVCYGFAFGKWTPPLDWRNAGHGPALDSARVPRAPDGRGWAASDLEFQSDTSIMLFPPWWPAGVVVQFPAKPKSLTDTVAGRAFALVADGRKTPSSSQIRAWLISCQKD
jgi:hypothetical protein